MPPTRATSQREWRDQLLFAVLPRLASALDELGPVPMRRLVEHDERLDVSARGLEPSCMTQRVIISEPERREPRARSGLVLADDERHPPIRSSDGPQPPVRRADQRVGCGELSGQPNGGKQR